MIAVQPITKVRPFSMSLKPLSALLCGYLFLTLLGMHGVPALLPELSRLWSMSYTEGGWLAGAPYLAYVAGVSVIGITDRIDARRLMLLGALINVAGYGGMILADGFWSALPFRILQGLGFAWTYLPGVKAFNDRNDSPNVGRAASVYVSSFAVGSSCSVLLAATIGESFGWRAAFVAPALTNSVAAALIYFLLPPIQPAGSSAARRLLPRFDQIWRNKPAFGFVLASFTHNFELLAVRSWTVTFLTWALLSRGDLPNWFEIPVIAMLLILIGAPCSVAGGEVGHRIGHARASFWTMLVSAAVAAVVGFAAAWPLWLFLLLVLAHNVFVLADSGTINAGAMARAKAAERGNLLAGFGLASASGGLCGPVVFGYVLDATGAGTTAQSWGAAFATLAVLMLLGSLSVRWLSWRRTAHGHEPT